MTARAAEERGLEREKENRGGEKRQIKKRKRSLGAANRGEEKVEG